MRFIGTVVPEQRQPCNNSIRPHHPRITRSGVASCCASGRGVTSRYRPPRLPARGATSEFSRIFNRDDALNLANELANAFSSNFAGWPPLMMMLQRLLTAACSRSCMAWFMLPSPTSSWGVIGSLRNFRIDTTGPSSANGSMTRWIVPRGSSQTTSGNKDTAHASARRA